MHSNTWSLKRKFCNHLREVIHLDSRTLFGMIFDCDYVSSSIIYHFCITGQCDRAVKTVKEGGSVVALTGAVVPPGFRFVVTSNGEVLKKLNSYLESGKVKPVVDPKGPFSFAQVAEAFAYIETNRAAGKVVISPIP